MKSTCLMSSRIRAIMLTLMAAEEVGFRRNGGIISGFFRPGFQANGLEFFCAGKTVAEVRIEPNIHGITNGGADNTR